MGFANFYQRFIYQYSKITVSLTNLLKDSKEGKKPGFLTLTVDAVEAFENLKKAVMTVLVLIYYNPQKEIQVETDTSDVAIAGILSQSIRNQEILNI